MRLSQFPIQIDTQTTSLFALDSLTNAIDFAFHFWLGRVLIPSDFAILQTLNSVLLVYMTASGVFQPVVSRFVAETRGKGQSESVSAIFQSFLRAAFLLGVGLGILVFWFSSGLAQILNLPAWTIQISAILIFLSTLRPIAAGVLQGQERFLSFGFSRLLTAFGRLFLGLILLHSGFGLTGAVIAFPFGWFAGLACAFLLLEKQVWMKGKRASAEIVREGWHLSLYALVAYLAFMSLTSIDLVWVNRTLSGELAGAYASLVLLRRVIALLPGVAVVVMFPRIARTLAEGRHPDGLLIRAATIILAASSILTAGYFLLGKEIISIIYGKIYLSASPLLGWMGLAMTGISLSAIWLNYYLAQKPRDYVICLGVAVLLEWFLLNSLPASMESAVISFGITAWLLAIAGLALYVFKHRPEQTEKVYA